VGLNRHFFLMYTDKHEKGSNFLNCILNLDDFRPSKRLSLFVNNLFPRSYLKGFDKLRFVQNSTGML